MARLHSSVSSMSDMIPTSPPLDVTLGHFPGCYKTAFVFFSEFGGWWWWGERLLMKLPKGTTLADFTHFEPLIVQIGSRVFFL